MRGKKGSHGGRPVRERGSHEAGKIAVELSAVGNRMHTRGIRVKSGDDPAGLVEAQLKEVASLEPGAAFTMGMLKGRPRIEREAKRYRGFTLHRISLEWDLDAMMQGLKLSRTGLARLGTGRGVTSWVGSKDRLYVDVIADDWEQARRVLDAYLDGQDTIGRQKQFREARAHMPREATVLMFEELSQYFQQMAAFSLGQVQGENKLPESALPRIPGPLPGRVGYYGLAYTARSGYLAVDLWVPAMAASEYLRVMGPISDRRAWGIKFKD
jgi:hypothetical protein